ncbi:tripartite tricarboxylate transporter TctB family protein [Brenneria sp. 4F2]|nr:tripartite tricarboxylate transporter TctB family protein [Brenneria bubanii]
MALKSHPSRRHAELFFAVLWLAVAAGMYRAAGEYSHSSAIFPRALAILLALGSLALIVRLYRRHKRQQHDQTPLLHAPVRAAVGFSMVVAYILLMNTLGYIAASLLFGIALPLLAGYRRIGQVMACIAGALLLIVVVFRILLERPLPPGIFETLLERAL